MELSPRVRAVCDLDVAEVREFSGRHEYDGKPQDLSPAGVRAGLARLARARASGARCADAYDEAQLAAAEAQKRVVFAELELHRRNPLFHLGELDLACYDRDYAPQEERDAARAEHLAAWPRVAEAAVTSLDRVSAPVAQALLGAVRGLGEGIGAGPGGGPGGAGRSGRGCPAGGAGRARAPGRAHRAGGGGRGPGLRAWRTRPGRADEQCGGHAGRPGQAG